MVSKYFLFYENVFEVLNFGFIMPSLIPCTCMLKWNSPKKLLFFFYVFFIMLKGVYFHSCLWTILKHIKEYNRIWQYCQSVIKKCHPSINSCSKTLTIFLVFFKSFAWEWEIKNLMMSLYAYVSLFQSYASIFFLMFNNVVCISYVHATVDIVWSWSMWYIAVF